MSYKKRFGVSVTSKVARDLDMLASLLNIDRSRIVEMALKEYLHDHLHLMKEHNCTGLIVVFKEDESANISEAIEEFKDIISAYNHIHVGNRCIETLIVSGSSIRILLLKKKLMETGCRVRYIPISY